MTRSAQARQAVAATLRPRKRTGSSLVFVGETGVPPAAAAASTSEAAAARRRRRMRIPPPLRRAADARPAMPCARQVAWSSAV